MIHASIVINYIVEMSSLCDWCRMAVRKLSFGSAFTA